MDLIICAKVHSINLELLQLTVSLKENQSVTLRAEIFAIRNFRGTYFRGIYFRELRPISRI